MSKIPNQLKYNKAIWLYTISRALERTAFYGMRSILIIYMLNSILSISESDTFEFYGWFVQAFAFSGVVGGILGDFVLGNKKALLVGGILISIGLFLIAIPYEAVFFTGIGFIVLGCGLYTPNLLALFGKQFYDKPELTDGGFSVLYWFVNVGAALGTTVIVFLAYSNYPLGFVICGIVMIVSVVLSFINKETIAKDSKPIFNTNPSNRSMIVLGTILVVGLYWYTYDLSNNGIYSLQLGIGQFYSQLNTALWSGLSSGLLIPIGGVIALIYSFYYFSRALKIVIGFILAAVGYGILFFISIPASESDIVLMILSIVILSIGEVILAPVVYSVITQKSNPKYLALIMSLSFLPYPLIKFILPFSLWEGTTQDTTILQVTTPLIAVLGIIILIVWTISKKSKSNNT